MWYNCTNAGAGTHDKKQRMRFKALPQRRDYVEQQITIVNEVGQPVGTTFPRRAKQLVFKGRAEWVDGKVCC